jgi:hypothetical protein
VLVLLVGDSAVAMAASVVVMAAVVEVMAEVVEAEVTLVIWIISTWSIGIYKLVWAGKIDTGP